MSFETQERYIQTLSMVRPISNAFLKRKKALCLPCSVRKTVKNYVYPANRSPCLSKNYRPSEIASKCINSKSSILFRLHCSLTQNVFYASFNNPQTQRTFLLGLWL